MSLAAVVYAARLGDLLREARNDLSQDEFADLLELWAIAISKAVADELERRWMGGQ